MNRPNTTLRILWLVAILATSLSMFAQPLPTDVITVANVSGSGVVEVPVYIRDTSATPLGIDQPAGSRIQSYSIRVSYSPASAVQSITFTRAGITAPLTPTFESSPAVAGSISLLGNFDETTNLIPFNANAPLPGDQVGRLNVVLSPSAAPGTVISLNLDPVLTQLTDEGGTPGTIETVANGRLTLVNGAILVAGTVPTLSEWAIGLLSVSIAVAAMLMMRGR